MLVTEALARAADCNAGRPPFSFEFFPPKTDEGVANLLARMERMASLGPSFISVTWPATGSDTAAAIKTVELCATAAQEFGLVPCCHLTCTNTRREAINAALDDMKRSGVRNIFALRGDPPRDAEHWEPTDASFRYAVDLVRHVRKRHGSYFCVGVAAYPEGHPDNARPQDELQRLKEKVDAGADFIITQFYFEVDAFIKWVKEVRDFGINVPIIAGIMPIHGYASFKTLIRLTKVVVPEEIESQIEALKYDDAAIKTFGVKCAASIVSRLRDAGVQGFHLSTLNLEWSVRRILLETGYIEKQPTSTVTTLAEKTRESVVRGLFGPHPRSPELWDDFPNGRFGDSRSPAFGEIDGYGVSLHIEPKEALRIWGSPKTLDDLGSLFASYCLGELRTLPWSPDPLLPESRSVAARLAELNRMHMFTVGSQPAVDGVPSDDPIVGWGPRVRGTHGWVYQKAFVEFFVAPDRAAFLLDRLRRNEKVTYYAGSLQRDGCETNASKDARNAVTWGVFVGQEIVQPTIVDEPAFMAWKTEAFAIWDEWSLIHPSGSATQKLLSEIHRTWWLVNVVYDDYKTGQDALFDLLVSSLLPAHERS